MNAHSKMNAERHALVVAAAQEAGFLEGARGQIGARVHNQLLAAAKERTGLTSTTDLIEYALAKVAIEDNFLDTMRRLKGSVSQDIDLEF